MKVSTNCCNRAADLTQLLIGLALATFYLTNGTQALAAAAEAQEALITAPDGTKVPANATDQDLEKLFGASNLQRSENRVQDNDGRSALQNQTIIFPGDPRKTATIFFRKGFHGRVIERAVIESGSQWITYGGVKFGQTLQEVARLNSKPFSIFGFTGVEGDGAVGYWNGGTLDIKEKGKIIPVFDAKNLGPEFRADVLIESNQPLALKAGLTVKRIVVVFGTPYFRSNGPEATVADKYDQLKLLEKPMTQRSGRKACTDLGAGWGLPEGSIAWYIVKGWSNISDLSSMQPRSKAIATDFTFDKKMVDFYYKQGVTVKKSANSVAFGPGQMVAAHEGDIGTVAYYGEPRIAPRDTIVDIVCVHSPAK